MPRPTTILLPLRIGLTAALKAGRLQIVLAKFQAPPLPIHLVYPTSRLLSAKVRAFIDLVVETADWRFG